MLGTITKKRPILEFRNRLVAGAIVLALIAGLTTAQVVLVPSRLRAPRATSKSKSKPKKKSRLVAKPISQQTAEVSPIVMPSSQLSFAIAPPLLNKPESSENAAKPKAWPELLGYEFDVINVDEKGRLE